MVKTPNLGKIRALKPDLIVMDREENPLKVYQTLFDEGFEIFVSSVESPSDVPDMLRALGAACDRNLQVSNWHYCAKTLSKELTETILLCGPYR